MDLLNISLSSNIANLLNFIIFDVLLISLVFYLTTDVSGRLNYHSLVDGSTKSLAVVSPPLVGGGLCSTSRPRSLLMLAVRAIAISLIFATAFTIDGKSVEQKRSRLETVLVPSTVLKSTKGSEIERAGNLQKSCKISNGGYIYFGRLSKNGYCESDVRLLQDQIRVEAAPLQINMTLKCVKSLRLSRSLYNVIDYNCTQSTFIQCYLREKLPFHAGSCRGIVRSNDAIFICNSFEHKINDTWIGKCRRAFNFNRIGSHWRNAVNKSRYNLFDLIGAINVMGVKAQQVEYFKKKDVTTVHMAWFGFFAAKLMLVIGLFTISTTLRSKGLHCILHDEHALMNLLRVHVSQKYGVSNDEVKLYLHGSSSESQTGNRFWVSIRPQSRPVNTAANQLEIQFH